MVKSSEKSGQNCDEKDTGQDRKWGTPDYEGWKQGVVAEVAGLPLAKFSITAVVVALIAVAYLFGEKFGPWFVLSVVLAIVVFGLCVLVYTGSNHAKEIDATEPKD